MKEKNPNDTQTVIGPAISVEGEFVGEGNVIVDGKLSGTLRTSHDLRVGREAVIRADVSAQNAAIAGEVTGDLTIKATLELASTARVSGNISCQTLHIEPGCVFNGQCKMSTSEKTESQTETA